MPSPDQIRRRADELEREADAALDAGDADAVLEKTMKAVALRAVAKELEALNVNQVSSSVEKMTELELARRGQGIAKSKASTPLHTAAVNDPRFRSLRKWAILRKEDRSSVSNYATGKSPCPARVDKKARKDFPEVFAPKGAPCQRWNGEPAVGVGWDWPKGVVE